MPRKEQEGQTETKQTWAIKTILDVCRDYLRASWISSPVFATIFTTSHNVRNGCRGLLTSCLSAKKLATLFMLV